MVVLYICSQSVDGLMIDFKDSRHGAFAGRHKVNLGTFVPHYTLFAEMLEQDEHIPRVAHAVETATKVGTNIVSIPKTHFHLYGNRGDVRVDVFD